MILKIEIPEEFIEHFGNDKFNDSLGRICYDIESAFKTGSGMSGRYEWELVEMLADAFAKSKDYDRANERMERRIARLTWCVESWKKANADLQETNDRLRKRIKELDSIPHTDNTAVIDVLQARIKELENKLYGSSGQSTRLLNRINNFRSTDPKATDLIEDCYKCIHQQMATISKMETTEPKWISVKDRLPEDSDTNDGGFVLVDIHEIADFPIPGIERVRVQEIYYENLEYDEENDCGIFVNTEHIMPGLDKCWFTHWMPLPSAPTTEEK